LQRLVIILFALFLHLVGDIDIDLRGEVFERNPKFYLLAGLQAVGHSTPDFIDLHVERPGGCVSLVGHKHVQTTQDGRRVAGVCILAAGLQGCIEDN